MMRASRSRFSLVLLSLYGATVQCRSPGEPAGARQPVRVTFSTSSSTTLGVVQSPYRSVADSVVVWITSEGSSPQTLGKHLAPGDSMAQLEVLLPQGSVSIFALVLSKNLTVLYSGARDLPISEATAVIDVPLAAGSPVLVVAPDTLRVTVSSTAGAFDSLAIHNRGLDSLAWSLPINPASACRCMAVREASGSVRAGKSMFLHLDRILHTITTGPQLVNVELASGAGSVVVVIRIQ